jgi:2'-5' RNA ligase
MLRVFFAVELAPPVRAAAARLAQRLREQAGAARVRWVRPENLHVTLRFLGGVAPDRIEDVVAHVAPEVGPLPRFSLRTGAVQLFPTPRRPHVVALAVAPEEALARVAAAIERGVVAAGLPAEARPFHAHLTLGRLPPRTRARDVAALADPAPAPVTAADTPADDACVVTEVVLMRSQLQRTGSRYTALARLPLAAPPHAPPGPGA